MRHITSQNIQNIFSNFHFLLYFQGVRRHRKQRSGVGMETYNAKACVTYVSNVISGSWGVSLKPELLRISKLGKNEAIAKMCIGLRRLIGVFVCGSIENDVAQRTEDIGTSVEVALYYLTKWGYPRVHCLRKTIFKPNSDERQSSDPLLNESGEGLSTEVLLSICWLISKGQLLERHEQFHLNNVLGDTSYQAGPKRDGSSPTRIWTLLPALPKDTHSLPNTTLGGHAEREAVLTLYTLSANKSLTSVPSLQRRDVGDDRQYPRPDNGVDDNRLGTKIQELSNEVIMLYGVVRKKLKAIQSLDVRRAELTIRLRAVTSPSTPSARRDGAGRQKRGGEFGSNASRRISGSSSKKRYGGVPPRSPFLIHMLARHALLRQQHQLMQRRIDACDAYLQGSKLQVGFWDWVGATGMEADRGHPLPSPGFGAGYESARARDGLNSTELLTHLDPVVRAAAVLREEMARAEARLRFLDQLWVDARELWRREQEDAWQLQRRFFPYSLKNLNDTVVGTICSWVEEEMQWSVSSVKDQSSVSMEHPVVEEGARWDIAASATMEGGERDDHSLPFQRQDDIVEDLSRELEQLRAKHSRIICQMVNMAVPLRYQVQGL